MIGDEPIGWCRYEKQKNSARSALCDVAVYLFALERQVRNLPEKAERQRRWFSPEEASAVVAAASLRELLLRSSDAMLAWTPRKLARGRSTNAPGF